MWWNLHLHPRKILFATAVLYKKNASSKPDFNVQQFLWNKAKWILNYGGEKRRQKSKQIDILSHKDHKKAIQDHTWSWKATKINRINTQIKMAFFSLLNISCSILSYSHLRNFSVRFGIFFANIFFAFGIFF